MKFYVFLLFASLLFIVAESFFVPEDWLIKHGYNVKKNASSMDDSKHRSFHSRKGFRMKAEDNIPVGPFTDDFVQYLETAGYADYDFPSLHLGVNASFGGKEFKDQELKHNPVIFIHGNSDGALDAGTEFSSGFSASIKYFLSKGYNSAELYAVTWGDRKLEKSFTRMHTCATMRRLRKFVEAVLLYTNAEKIDVIAHSMGVTLIRQVLKGGRALDYIEQCDLGQPLNEKVQTLVGIAAANYGLCMCNYTTSTQLPVCGYVNGFYSGAVCKVIDSPEAPTTCERATPEDNCDPVMSLTLNRLNGRIPQIYGPLVKDADNIFSFWSEEDEIVGKNSVFGRKTSLIPFSKGFKVFSNMKHHQLKTDTVEHQYKAIVEGNI